MPAGRRVLVLATAVLLAASGAFVSAQFGNLLKKNLPKPPGPATPPAPAFCSGITSKHIDQFLKALESQWRTEVVAQQHEARARAIEAKASQAATDQMMAAMARHEACQQDAIAKDPRSKETDRLSEARNRAQDRGDEATADKLGDQFAALIDAIEKDARTKCIDPACLAQARARSQLQQMVAELRASAAKATGEQKAMFESQIPGYLAMIETEAQLTCSGMSGELTLSAADQAETDAAKGAARAARDGSASSAAREAGLGDDEFNKLVECVCGGVNNPSGTPLSTESKDVIEARRGELAEALKKTGKC